jgi:hypothetical protein
MAKEVGVWILGQLGIGFSFPLITGIKDKSDYIL